MALRLEHRLTKREILALYLNLAPYGNQLTGAERAGAPISAAAPALLTPAQAAFLAALPQRPSTFNPYRDAARRGRGRSGSSCRWVLQGLLPPDRVGEALRERLTLDRAPAPFIAPHFVDRVLASRARRRRRAS